VFAAWRRDPEIGSLKLAFFPVVTIYSLTAAGFRMMSLMWIFFLWAIIRVPKKSYTEGA
jgi:energy-coupling factor transporter transmembrane protein EcfT